MWLINQIIFYFYLNTIKAKVYRWCKIIKLKNQKENKNHLSCLNVKYSFYPSVINGSIEWINKEIWLCVPRWCGRLHGLVCGRQSHQCVRSLTCCWTTHCTRPGANKDSRGLWQEKTEKPSLFDFIFRTLKLFYVKDQMYNRQLRLNCSIIRVFHPTIRGLPLLISINPFIDSYICT